MNNNATRQVTMAANELRDRYGVVSYKRPRRCPGCGRAMYRVNPDGACLACHVEQIEVAGVPRPVKRRSVPQVYSPAVYAVGCLSGRVG